MFLENVSENQNFDQISDIFWNIRNPATFVWILDTLCFLKPNTLRFGFQTFAVYFLFFLNQSRQHNDAMKKCDETMKDAEYYHGEAESLRGR